MSRLTSPAVKTSMLSRRRLLTTGGALALAPHTRPTHAGTPIATPRSPSSLRVAVGALPASFDPLSARSLEHTWLNTLIVDAVTRWNADSVILPALGLSWSSSAYNRIIDISLRPDAYFADGRPLTADDVRWTLERVRNSGEGVADVWRLEHVWRIQSVNRRMVRIILEAPDASLVSSLAAPTLSVLPEATDPPELVGGTGPYVISFRSRDLVTFRQQPLFWQVGRPRIKTLQIRQIADDTERSTALVTGLIHFLPNAPLLDIPMLQAEPSVRLVGGSSNRLCLLHLNLTVPELRNVHVRRLISAAIDRQRLVQVATADQAEATSLLFPERSWAHGDIDEVRQRSAEDVRAGLVELGILTDLRLRLLTNNADATLANTAIVLQEQLAWCGIALSVELLQDDELETAIRFGDYDLLAGYTSPWRDPHELVRPLLASKGSGNHSGYANPDVDGLIRAATIITNHDLRRERYTRLEEQVQADAPVIVLFRPHYFDAMTHRLAGYAVLPPVSSRGLLSATLDPATGE